MMPSGMYQLIERSVGKPGIFVTAKKVPANTIMLKIGMASAGKNADGRRRIVRMLRLARMPMVRCVLDTSTSPFVCAVVGCSVVLIVPSIVPRVVAGQVRW